MFQRKGFVGYILLEPPYGTPQAKYRFGGKGAIKYFSTRGEPLEEKTFPHRENIVLESRTLYHPFPLRGKKFCSQGQFWDKIGIIPVKSQQPPNPHKNALEYSQTNLRVGLEAGVQKSCLLHPLQSSKILK